jgi:ArsR family transcriptional regulator, lead/cadmium/zinc/bismuth-responsive transcriptional repressor
MSKTRYRKMPLDEKLAKRARLLALAGDETRIRILCFMFEYGEACVSDIAESLGVHINTISHHLRIMKDNGFFTSERTGTTICYKLTINDFTDSLKKAICE